MQRYSREIKRYSGVERDIHTQRQRNDKIKRERDNHTEIDRLIELERKGSLDREEIEHH